MGDWNVRIDETKNRLYLTVEGQLSVAEAEKAADAVIEKSGQLDPGFDEVMDMKTFRPTEQEALEHIERGKRGLVENDVGAVCRVVSESTTGQMQFDRAGEGEEDYPVAKADSVEQAETLLDQRRSG
jgi:prolyl oligopeptidase PreP (S9A serine peptidase family)